MDTNLNSPVASPRTLSSEGWATLAGLAGSALLLAKKFLAPKAPKAEPLSRADFYTEMLATRDRMHAAQITLLERLDTNHREMLGALERLTTRISALESSVARLDERTSK